MKNNKSIEFLFVKLVCRISKKKKKKKNQDGWKLLAGHKSFIWHFGLRVAQKDSVQDEKVVL